MPGQYSSTSRDTNEMRKFVDVDGQVAVAITGVNGASLTADSFWTMDFDTITVAYPDDVTEVYSSRIGGVAGAVQEVVTVIYLDDTKEAISNIVRS